METNANRRNVYLVDGARTPFLKTPGKPNPSSGSDLAVQAARPLLMRLGVPLADYDQVVVGCVMPTCEEANIGRLIALRLGFPHHVPGWTVQRNCASGLQAIHTAMQSIESGDANLVLAGGTEAMSQAPLLFNQAMTNWFAEMNRAKGWQKKVKNAVRFRPSFLSPVIALLKGLTDASVGMNMGQTAEELAFRFSISREEMDAFAARSHANALAGYASGEFADELGLLTTWKGEAFEQDNGMREDSTPEKLAKLRSVFDKYGHITAGNSSQISDGAAFMVLASEEAVEQYDLPVLGRLVDCEWAGLDPAVMGLGPVHAMVPLLRRHGLGLNDLSIVEINEAFAAQVLACRKALACDEYCQTHFDCDAPGEIPMDKLNPDGGAIALGHPVGASGARLVLHALNRMNRHGGRYGIASLCIGGGQGGAMLIESLSTEGQVA